MRILIVDDTSVHRKLLRLQLEAEGIEVMESADGVDALERLMREPFDAVLSDVLMPRMDGYRLCHEVRKSPALRALRFVLYSSTYNTPDAVELSTTVGADQFIVKPAPIEAVLQALHIPGVTEERPSELPNDALVVAQYSVVLVEKLEKRNNELQQALETARLAYDEIRQLNHGLEARVSERTMALTTANAELTTALAEIRQLNGLLPLCSYCRRIRDDKNYWDNVETYITRHTNSKFSHGICPTCYEKHVVPMLDDMGSDSTPAESPN